MKSWKNRSYLFLMVIFLCTLFVQKAQGGAAPTWQATSAIAASTGADVTVTLPAHQANDIFLLVVVVRDQDDTITWPSGWTQIATVDRLTVSRYWWAWRRAASSSETNPLVDKSTATGDTYATVITFRGAIATGDPWEVKGTPATGTSDPAVLTGITTLTPYSLVVAAFGGEDDNNASVSWTATDPATMTDRYTESSTGSDGVVDFGHGVRTTPGATGNVSGNFNVANPVGWGGIVLALKGPLPDVYYSVGQNTTDHKTGSPTIAMVSGVATFSVAQTATNMGVGDRVTYNTNSIAYISGKISSTQWRLVTVTGGTPSDVSSAQTVTSIAHEYTSLSAAISGASDANHLNTSDLVTGNYVLNIPCYYDSGADTTQAAIDGWTTGANNYIKIYTPANTSTECNQSQRHNGKWKDSGAYRLVRADENPLYIEDNHARVDGLQIEEVRSNDLYPAGINVTAQTAASEIYISNCVIRMSGTDGGNAGYGIIINDSDVVAYIWNNIIYNINSYGRGIDIAASAAYVYNNTIYNCGKYGINQSAGTVILKNNLSNTDGEADYEGTFSSSTNNISKDGTAVTLGIGSQATVTFVSAGGGDFHLSSSDTSAKNAGTDLSADAHLAFSTDIDGQGRPMGAAWDIGADEVGATQVYYSVGQNTSPIVSGGTATYTSSTTWTCPADVTSVIAECWGGGGAGGGATGNPAGGGGGAGGAYAIKTVSVTPGNNYTVTVGAAVSGTTGNGSDGNPSWFSTTGTVYAEGGQGGQADNGTGGTGSSASSIGDVVYAGGNGYAGSTTQGSPGGGGAGSTGAGGNATSGSGGTGTSSGGGNGGNYRATANTGRTGSTYGGGGGGGFSNTATDHNGGTGAAGQVKITYGPTITISGGTATFSTALTATNMGVGDRVTYNTNSVAYISGKISSTQWNLVTNTGATPSDVTSAQSVNSIAHEYTSVSAAISGASDASHINNRDLTAANVVLNIPCYYDTGADTTAVSITYYANGGYNTGANNYINIYTPTNTSTECNQSQRHDGKWNTSRFRMEVTDNPGIGVLAVAASFLRIDGLQIAINETVETGHIQTGIEYYGVPSGASDERVSNCIVKAIAVTGGGGAGGIYVYDADVTVRIWNNIVYDFVGTGYPVGIAADTCTAAYIYNNTTYNNKVGIDGTSGSCTVIAKNNIAQASAPAGFGGTFDASSDYNISDKADAPGSNSKNSVTVSFVNSGSRDLHLSSSDTVAMEAGTDLSAGVYIAFSTDIDGDSRPFGKAWDIGADEYTSVTAVFLKSFSATEYEGKVLLQWKSGYEANNLGFHIYREEDGLLVQINPELITGAALLAGAGRATAGHSYAWVDALSIDTGPIQYWLEDVDLSGKGTMNGPAIPDVSLEPLPGRGQAALLSQLARGQSEEDRIASRLWALQTRLGKTQTSDTRPQTSYLRRQTSAIRPWASAPGLSDRPGTPITLPSGQTKNLPPQEVQWMLAGWPAIKLFIQEEGWYRVTQPELVAAGLDPRVKPRNLQLYVDGQEQAIVVNVKQDGQFGSQDSIEFYGTGLDNPFTDTRVYWLVAGAKPGERVPLVGSLNGQAGSASFPFTVEQKPRTVYVAAVKNGDESNFFGPLVWTTPVEQVLSVSHLDPAALGATTLEVALQGGTEGDHQVQILLNDTEVGSLVFTGQSRGVTTLSVSQPLLMEGNNRVGLVAQGGEMDVSLIDYIRLTYWHTYSADSDSLKFTAVGGQQVLVGGFGSSSVRVVDITDPKMVQEVVSEVKQQGSGYGLQFVVPGNGQRIFLAFTGSQAKSAAAVEANQPSKWYQAGWGVDLVMISHASFIDSLQPLKTLREAQGLAVALIDVEDLYSEFGFGNKTPQALKDFLLRARVNWQKPPRFVLLVGDASFDPRNYLGLGNFDLVPTKLIDTAYLETASDDWLADFHGDGLPEMAVGRLPVRTVEEAQLMVSKIVGYEQSVGGMSGVMLVADMPANGDFDFEGASSDIGELLPGGLSVAKVFRSQFGDDDQVHTQILQGWNSGELLVNYIGHGSEDNWRGDTFTMADAQVLTNGLRLPFVVSMTCLNGFFQDVYSDSLAEALLKAQQGGAVAVWASSGLTDPDKQAVMNKEVVRLLFNGESLTLGEATKRAKAVVSDQDVRRTWILFGDPTTKLK